MTTLWYVSYGSNLLEERFRCYLEGGVPPGSTGRPQPPARDPRPPSGDLPVAIPHRLRFFLRSPRWHDGGVAFVEPERDPTARTLARAWRIDAGQLADVARGESGAEATVEVDLDRLRHDGRLDHHPGHRYGTLVHLGRHPDGGDLVTITCAGVDGLGPANPPHESYRGVMARGLAEAWRLDAGAADRYLDRHIG